MRLRVKVLIRILGIALTMTLSLLTLYRLSDIVLPREQEILNVLITAFFSHLTIIARGFFVPLFLSLTEKYHPLLLGLSAGLGGGLGEIIAYYWGLSIRESLASTANEREGEDVVPRWIEKYGIIAVLLFAASPLPDTPIILLAGALRFPLWKMIIVQVIGKTTLYSFGAIFGSIIFMELKSMVEEALISTIILVASVALCALISWGRSRKKILQALDKSFRIVLRQRGS